MDENREMLELEIEDEYRERILAGEKLEPKQFLKKQKEKRNVQGWHVKRKESKFL